MGKLSSWTVIPRCSIIISKLDNANICKTAAEALGAIGPDAEEAIPDLIDAFESKDADFRKPGQEGGDSVLERHGLTPGGGNAWSRCATPRVIWR